MKYLKSIILAAAFFLFQAAHAQEPAAKYIFLFIGDGMGAGHVAVTESYLSYKAGVLGGEQLTFTRFPQLALCTTYSANANITDSSASGTAIATGVKTNNGALGVDASNNPVYSVAHYLKQDFGYKVGIFSSVPLNHATPAAFYGHSTSRSNYYEITTQIPESGFEFIGGAGFLKYSPASGDENSETFLEKHGYDVVFGQSEFKKRNRRRNIVMSSDPNESGREHAANYSALNEENVSLCNMLDNCLEVLGDKKPFFIMCEGGEIDWDAHSNYVMPLIESILKFDAAIAKAYEFYLAHPDETLIIVTADHETGGISLGTNNCSDILDWPAILEDWENSGHTKHVLECGIGWTSHHHTGGPVPVYAIGKGSEKIHGRMDNTDFFNIILNR